MEKTTFLIQGSASEPYEVAIYTENNEITDYRCSCPAGSVGNILCKHVLAVLTGDSSNMVSNNLDDLDKIKELIPLPQFKETYAKLKELLVYEKCYYSIKDIEKYIGGKLVNDYSEIKPLLDKEIIIKVRNEKNFIETTFQYEEKEYFDFYTSDLEYLFTTYSSLDEDFFKTLKKKKIKLDTKTFKNFNFYTTSEDIKEKLAKYSTSKKKISDYRCSLKNILEAYLEGYY